MPNRWSENVNQSVRKLISKLKIFLGISFGVFLFILFFQPFTIEGFDFNDTLLFVAGFGGIVFVLMITVFIFQNWINPGIRNNKNEFDILSYQSGFVLFALSSVAFVFYLHYVGFATITFYVTFKIVLVCLAPPLILGLNETILQLRQQKGALIIDKRIMQLQLEKYEEDILNKTIEFVSENNTENLILLVSEVVFIKSADNYVEIVFKEEDKFKKRLIRNTLKAIEHQIIQYSNFIRCHRICIVNAHYIEKLHKNYNNYWLTVNGSEEKIPVSRQYLLRVKEFI